MVILSNARCAAMNKLHAFSSCVLGLLLCWVNPPDRSACISCSNSPVRFHEAVSSQREVIFLFYQGIHLSQSYIASITLFHHVSISLFHHVAMCRLQEYMSFALLMLKNIASNATYQAMFLTVKFKLFFRMVRAFINGVSNICFTFGCVNGGKVVTRE